MDPAIRELLVKNDLAGEWYDQQADSPELRELQAINPQIEAIAGRELDIDPHVQDATYLTDIGLLDDRYYNRKTQTGSWVFLFAFRFSCVARMFTVHGTEWRTRSEEWNIDAVIRFLKDRGFAYIPEDELRVPYDGPNKWRLGGPATWWARFFDYV